MPDPGELTEKLTYEEPTTPPKSDGYTSEETPYEEVEDRWAKVVEDAGRKDVRAGRKEPRQRVTITMRSWDRVSLDGRFDWDGTKIYLVGKRSNTQRGRWMKLEGYLDLQE